MAVTCTGTVYRSQLAQELATELGLSLHFARAILGATTTLITNHLIANRAVVLREFGQFYTKRVAAHTLRSNLPGQTPITISARRTPVWRPSDTLKRLIAAGSREPVTDGAGVPSPAPSTASACGDAPRG